MSFNTASGKYYCNFKSCCGGSDYDTGFNTASGKYYCNLLPSPRSFATISGFNTASGKYYCNFKSCCGGSDYDTGFNTASGKYYCNRIRLVCRLHYNLKFQYRKR